MWSAYPVALHREIVGAMTMTGYRECNKCIAGFSLFSFVMWWKLASSTPHIIESRCKLALDSLVVFLVLQSPQIQQMITLDCYRLTTWKKHMLTIYLDWNWSGREGFIMNGLSVISSEIWFISDQQHDSNWDIIPHPVKSKYTARVKQKKKLLDQKCNLRQRSW
jgi:hypothetical protein